MLALLPFMVISGTSVGLMLVIAFYRSHGLTVTLSLFGVALSFASLFVVFPLAPHAVTSLLVFDYYALFYMALVFAATLAVIGLSFGYLKKQGGTHEEFYVLLLLAAFGSAVLVASSHFASFFLGLEILSVSLYILMAYVRNERGVEAGIKYLILAAVSAAFLLFGIALVYAQTGTMDFGQIATRVKHLGSPPTLMLTGISMIIVGIGFKLAVVPFHLWTPDVYEGAPAPVTAFVATVSKGAVFVLLLRYFTQIGLQSYSTLSLIFGTIAIASMLVGNLLALLQTNIKRILAYSSIAHMGYLLVAFLASGPLVIAAVTFYLVAYFITTLGAFGVITVLSDGAREADRIDDYRGLAWQRPWMSAVFTIMLLSLAGIPLTAGFIGKFYIVAAGVHSALWTQVVILVMSSAIGLFYYVRVIVALYAHPAGRSVLVAPLSVPGGLILAVLVVLLVGLGAYPSLLIELIQAALYKQL